MKVISAHQPAYLPWFGYFHKILLSDAFVVMDDVQFEKNSFINRNKILQNGNGTWLTMPVITKDYKTKTIRDIKVMDQRWKRKHLMSIEQSYKKYECFAEVMPLISKTLTVESEFMVDYTNAFLHETMAFLGLSTPISFASELNIEARKLDYVIELTKKMGGDVFVFGSQGKDYADETLLKEEGIQPYFQAYTHPTYPQRTEEFVPYLSILDALFSLGDKTLDLIEEGNMTRKGLS